MKKMILFFFPALIFFAARSQQNMVHPALIPEPVTTSWQAGALRLTSAAVIQATDASAKPVAMALQSRLFAATGFKPSINSTTTTGTIHLRLNKKPDPVLGTEGYKLSVSSKEITITANEPAGLFYGCQTLYQLLPKEIESKTPVKNIQWQLPCVSITDYPRFGWRGLMFDVSRHFFTRQEVKDFIDQMVKYKYNLLHMHLTDDEGWRVEIKKPAPAY